MWQSPLAGADEVSVRWLALNQCQSGLAMNKCQFGLSQTVGHTQRGCSLEIPDRLFTPTSLTLHVAHTPTNSPPFPGLAHWTDKKVSALGFE